MATYVLVHGAWHGGWCWQLVAPIMRVAKHDVYTPTLTGMGERSHLLACGVDLNTHIRDITNLLFYEDLTNIVLVGHGAASLVVNGVVAEMAERIGQIVYFDAYMPVDSQFPFNIWPMEQQTGAPVQVTTLQAVRLPPAATTLGISERRMVEWVEKRLVSQPLSTYQLAGQNNISHHAAMFATDNANTTRAYIHCTVGSMSQVTAPYAARARADGWIVHELTAGHDAMLITPQEVADVLLAFTDTSM